jgi:drug/metabolite transporter (DMT)-like permease
LNEPSADGRRRLLEGIALGLSAASAWAFYNVGTDIGRSDGFSSADLAMLRYGVSALLLTPFLIMARSAWSRTLTPWRIIFLTIAIGPAFALLINTGYGIAPLAHAVVISPGTTMLTTNAFSWLVDGRPMPAYRQIGMAMLCLGLVAIAADQSFTKDAGTPVWLGDLCFVGSGFLWGVFTWLIGRWKLPAVETIGAVSVLAAITLLPVYLIGFGITQHPLQLWLEQAVYQGALGGCIAIVTFAACVARLGAGPAALFPALVPPFAVLLAVPLSSQWPSGLQWLGITLATFGLIVSLDVIQMLLRKGADSRAHAKDCG